MRLLRAATEALELENVHEGIQKYAILSHRWLSPEEEVTYADIVSNRTDLERKEGWKKLNWCRQQAVSDGLQYVWADTACIDKSSSQELTESINAMYRWYQAAEYCYVYLQDMPDQILLTQRAVDEEICQATRGSVAESGKATAQRGTQPLAIATILPQTTKDAERSPLLQRDDQLSRLDTRFGGEEEPVPSASIRTIEHGHSKVFEHWNYDAFAKSEWFTRAWTLQEMIAPDVVRFYNQNWKLVGELQDLAVDVARITGVHKDLLTKRRPLKSYSIAQKMSWAALRRSTKVEDRAYSLLGIMNVAMGVIYGEGDRAFQRLQDELLRVSSSDDSIFAFRAVSFTVEPDDDGSRFIKTRNAAPLLAESPESFHGCGDIALATWRKSKNQHQTAIKEVNFYLRAKTERQSRLKFWRSPKVFFRQAILNCSLEDKPSTIVKLNLFAMTARPDAFYVRADGRITTSRLGGDGNAQVPYESFSVIRNPDEGQINWNSTDTLILCIRKSNSIRALYLQGSSIPDAWYPGDETFCIPSRCSDLQAELAVIIHEIPTIKLRLVNSSNHFRVEFEFEWFHLPAWTNFPPRHILILKPSPSYHDISDFGRAWWRPHDCTIMRVTSGYLITKAYPRKTYLGDFSAHVVEIQHVGLPRFVLFLMSRIPLFILTFVTVCIMLFLNPQGVIVLVCLFIKGDLAGRAFLILWAVLSWVWFVDLLWPSGKHGKVRARLWPWVYM